MTTPIPVPRAAFRRDDQRGAATLVIVMVLFFIMAMMAAFASRNLIFEQRIASNYYRSGLALEVADAGADWVLGMLNGINVDQTCKATGNTATASTSFSQRYLTIDPATRKMTPVAPTPAASAPTASCVRVAGQQGWTCQCPESGWADAVVPAANQMQPGFSIRFQPSGQAGVVRILSAGCTGSQTAVCDNDQGNANNQLLGASVVRIEAALVSALKMPPAMPLTVKGAVVSSAGGLGLHNSDPRSSGLLLLTGSTLPVLNEDRLDSLPGTPPRQGLVTDPGLLDPNLNADFMFKMFFGMSRTQYRNQPAMRVIRCSGDCGPTLANAYNQGVRMAWIDGDLLLASDLQLGTQARPMLIVATGDVALTGPMRLHGLLHAKGNVVWQNGGGQALLNGAMIVEGGLNVVGPVDLSYDAAVINALSNGLGSFVRVPGSWWDVGNI